MKSLCFVLGSLILAVLSVGEASGQYYYSNNRQIPLYVDSTKVMILFSDDAMKIFLDISLDVPIN